MSRRAADVKAIRAPPRWPAVAGRHLRWSGANRERGQTSRAPYHHAAQRVAPADLPGDPLGDRADALVQARPAPTTHVTSPPLAVAAEDLATTLLPAPP